MSDWNAGVLAGVLTVIQAGPWQEFCQRVLSGVLVVLSWNQVVGGARS